MVSRTVTVWAKGYVQLGGLWITVERVMPADAPEKDRQAARAVIERFFAERMPEAVTRYRGTTPSTEGEETYG